VDAGSLIDGFPIKIKVGSSRVMVVSVTVTCNGLSTGAVENRAPYRNWVAELFFMYPLQPLDARRTIIRGMVYNSFFIIGRSFSARHGSACAAL